MESGLLKKVFNMLGTNFQNIKAKVSDEVFKEMTSEIVSPKKYLSVNAKYLSSSG